MNMNYTRQIFIIFLIFSTNYTLSQTPASPPKKLKILFVTDIFPCFHRPYLNNQIKEFIDRGHDVWIHALSKYDLVMTKILENYNLEKKIQYGLELSGTFDIILCQFGFLANWVSSCIKQKKLSGKFIVFLRGSEISSYVKQNPHMYDKLFPEVDLFLPVCNHFKKRLIALGCSTNKVKVIHSAIFCNHFHYKIHAPDKNKHINILTVAQIHKRKGLEYSVKAIAELHKIYPKIQYTIVGGGHLQEVNWLKKLVHELHAQNFIHFAGKRQHHTISSFLDAADIFVLSSITTPNGLEEGIPNALMEAMACGIPCVSTYHAGIPELIQHGVSGYLAPEKNIPKLVQNITSLIKQPELCIKMGKLARARVEKKHNIKIEIEKLEQLLYNLLT